MAGEGATFFVVSDRMGSGSLARIDDLEIMHRCDGFDGLKSRLDSFLARNGLVPSEIDLLVTGRNGDARYSGFYDRMERLFEGSTIAGYKHLVGEYDTSSAFGAFLAAKILKENSLPDVVRLNHTARERFSRSLVFNYSKNRDFTFLLLSGLQN